MFTQQQTQQNIDVKNLDMLIALFGRLDENIRAIQEQLNVQIQAQGTEVMVVGDEQNVATAMSVINKLLILLAKGDTIDKSRIRYAVELAAEGNAEMIEEIMGDVVAVTYRGKPIKCKTAGQKKYVSAIRKNTVVFGIGPAGTGKTYLAMAMAVVALKNRDVSRIILTRPAVEAGEKLGFLPGDLQHKVDPYLRPLYDALYEMMGPENYTRLAESGVIEVAPLAYMRGRTLSDSFIILDEAQNTTSEQMKMFLTRFGDNSRVVITGDVTQTDLPTGKKSGLIEAATVLKNIPSIDIVYLTHRDVVRHELVQSIIRAYDRRENRPRT